MYSKSIIFPPLFPGLSPFLFRYSDRHLQSWLRSAISLDKFQPLSNKVLYSSSLLDIFTSFQQQVDYLLTTFGGDDAFLTTQLIEVIDRAIEQYVVDMGRLISKDLNQLHLPNNKRNGFSEVRKGNSFRFGIKKKNTSWESIAADIRVSPEVK